MKFNLLPNIIIRIIKVRNYEIIKTILHTNINNIIMKIIIIIMKVREIKFYSLILIIIKMKVRHYYEIIKIKFYCLILIIIIMN